MRFDLWTFGFQVVNLLVLLWLLGHFLFRPVAGIIAERQAATARTVEAAETARSGAEQARADLESERARQATERTAMLDAAHAEAERQKETILAQARAEAERIVQHAKAEAERTAEEGRRRQRRLAVELAVSICRRLLANLPQDARVAGYPERLAEALARLDPDQRHAMAEDSARLQLIAAKPLTEDEAAAVRNALCTAFPQAASTPITEDPELIAGLELQGPHGVVRDSLRADLARIAEALDTDERG